MKPLVTAILLSWKRKPNMAKIVKSLRNQTVPVSIWVINNNGNEDFGADLRISVGPWNAGEWLRYPFTARIKTPYGMFQDDDFLIQDNKFLEDAIEIYKEKSPDNLLGVAGRGLQITPPHYRPDYVHIDAYANILKGHFQLFRKEVPRRAKFSQFSTADIYWSLDIGNGERVHWVSKDLSSRLKLLEQYGEGLEFRPEHYKERNEICATWLRDNGKI